MNRIAAAIFAIALGTPVGVLADEAAPQGVAVSTSAGDAWIERTVELFLTLCPIGADHAGLEAALERAIIAGQVQREDDIVVIHGHSPWPIRTQVIWQGRRIELAWGAGGSCALIDVMLIDDKQALNAAITERLGVASMERIVFPAGGRTGPVGSAAQTVWTMVRDGETFELASFQRSPGPWLTLAMGRTRG